MTKFLTPNMIGLHGFHGWVGGGVENTSFQFTKWVVVFFSLMLQISPISHFDRLNSAYPENR